MQTQRWREHAARTHRPDQIDLLLVAEAPPAADDRYFYFDDVATNDWLFRGVVEVVLERQPTQGPKGPTLQELKRRGVFLIDLKADPVDGSDLEECVDDLVARCLSLKPRRVVLIKATVFDLAYRALLNAGVPVVNARLPFPSHGHQAIFRRQFAAALRDNVPLQSQAGNWGSLIEERLKALGEFLGASQWFGRENELVNLFAHSFLALKPTDAAQIGIEVAVKQLQRLGGKELVRKDLVLWREPRMNVWVDRVPANDPVAVLEFKVNDLRKCAADVEWLTAYTTTYPDVIGYSVCGYVTETRGLSFVRVANGHVGPTVVAPAGAYLAKKG